MMRMLCTLWITLLLLGCDVMPGVNFMLLAYHASQHEASNGVDGTPGDNGLACWDLNADRVCDEVEDSNGDDVCDALDCQGPAGPAGPSEPIVTIPAKMNVCHNGMTVLIDVGSLEAHLAHGDQVGLCGE